MHNVRLEENNAVLCCLSAYNDDVDSTRILIRLLHVGKYRSGISGEVFEITEKKLTEMSNVFNGMLLEKYNKYKTDMADLINKKRIEPKPIPDIEDFEFIKTIKDHNLRMVDNTVGHVVGNSFIDTVDGVKCLFIHAKIVGKENVTKVKDRRYSNTSYGANWDTCEPIEVSFVSYGADKNSCALSSDVNNDTNNLENNLHTTTEYGNIDAMYDDFAMRLNRLYKAKESMQLQELLNNSLMLLCKEHKISSADMFFIQSTVKSQDDKSNVSISSLVNILDFVTKKRFVSKRFDIK